MPAERYWEVLNSVAKRDFKKMMPLKNKPVYIIGNGDMQSNFLYVSHN